MPLHLEPRPSRLRPIRFVRTAALLLSVAFASGCTSLAAWRGNPIAASSTASPTAAAKDGRSAKAEATVQTTSTAEPELPPPSGVRPCCIFGTGVKVDVAKVEVPLFELENVVSIGDLGRHDYDAGTTPVTVDDKGVFAGEKNGLVFTCQAGFIDTAHVRDYADWTLFLAARLDECLDGGCVLPLPAEGGERFLVVSPPPASARAPKQRLATLIAIARWAAFQLSIWHEIATGSGWSAFAAFPELASAFSPEDLFSNALGTELGGEIAARRLAKSEGAYNEAMTEQLAATLSALGAASPDETRAVLKKLDGDWWDSSEKLPSSRLVKRRVFDVGPAVRPVEVPRAAAPKWCAKDRKRKSITLPARVGGRRIEDFVTLYVEVAKDERVKLPGATPPWITQRSFPGLIRALRAALAKDGAPPKGATPPKA